MGDDACPFNFFYWDFLARHRDILKNQGRMNFILKNLDKMSQQEYSGIRQASADWHTAQTTSGKSSSQIS